MTIRARLRAYGHRYRTDFGTNHEGWSVQRARGERDGILQQSRARHLGATEP